MKYLIIAVLFLSCKKETGIKKPAPITYGDPRNNIIDTIKYTN